MSKNPLPYSLGEGIILNPHHILKGLNIMKAIVFGLGCVIFGGIALVSGIPVYLGIIGGVVLVAIVRP